MNLEFNRKTCIKSKLCMAESNPKPKFKLLVVGDSGVGKTSLIE